jgi:hypothetical protein
MSYQDMQFPRLLVVKLPFHFAAQECEYLGVLAHMRHISMEQALVRRCSA